MYFQISEIEKTISHFDEDNRKELGNYYSEVAKQKLNDSSPFSKKKLSLLKSAIKYLPDKERLNYIDEVFTNKILQTRALILDIIVSNYFLEQQYVYKPEKWIEMIISDIKEAFDLKDKEDIGLLKVYNEKLCNEIILIFCSCEKFNSAGNQLILNMVAYEKEVGYCTEYDFSNFTKKLYSHFNENKAVSLYKIEEIYEEYKSSLNKSKVKK